MFFSANALSSTGIKKIREHSVIFLIATFLKSIFKENLSSIEIKNDTLYFSINKNIFYLFAYFLKKNSFLKVDQLIDICVEDRLLAKDRFLIRYFLTSTSYAFRFCIVFSINELEPIDSLSFLYLGSAWYEREIWDMFGIFFKNHPDMRRLLTDYGFKGHPLRKDFPLTGYVELFYDDSVKSLIYRKVALAQEFRNFKFINPWVKKGL